MYGEDVAIVAIVFGSVLAIVFMGTLGSVIKTWLKRKSGDNLSENTEFLTALREFKEKTDRRLSNLEAIVTDEHPKRERAKPKDTATKTRQGSSIEIEIDEEALDEENKEKGRLKNMLNQ